MKLTLAALALALTACAADSEPYGGDVLPGRTLGKTLCLTGCEPEVQGVIERNNWFEVEKGVYQLVEEIDNAAGSSNNGDHTDFGTGVQATKTSRGNENTGELATDFSDSGAVPTGDHGNFNTTKDQYPCAGVPYSGVCSNACGTAGATSQAPGGFCAAVACPDTVVIARCDL